MILNNKKEKPLINKTKMNNILANSNLAQYAINELKLAGYYNDNSENPSKWLKDGVLELLSVFISHGHSGSSAPIEINLFTKLANFMPITPLTFKEDEWMQIDADTYQNKRCSRLFMDNDGYIHDIDAYNLLPKETKYLNTPKLIQNKKKITWNSSFFVIDKNNKFTGEYGHKCYLPYNIDSYYPKKTITIPCKEIEVDKDNWIFCVYENNSKFNILKQEYDVKLKQSDIIKGKHIFDVDKLDIDEFLNSIKDE